MKRVFEKRVRNNLEEVVWTLAPYREEIRGIAVESTFNWYCWWMTIRARGNQISIFSPLP